MKNVITGHHLGVVLGGPEAHEAQTVEEVSTRVVWVRAQNLALGILVRPY